MERALDVVRIVVDEVEVGLHTNSGFTCIIYLTIRVVSTDSMTAAMRESGAVRITRVKRETVSGAGVSPRNEAGFLLEAAMTPKNKRNDKKSATKAARPANVGSWSFLNRRDAAVKMEKPTSASAQFSRVFNPITVIPPWPKRERNKFKMNTESNDHEGPSNIPANGVKFRWAPAISMEKVTSMTAVTMAASTALFSLPRAFRMPHTRSGAKSMNPDAHNQTGSTPSGT